MALKIRQGRGQTILEYAVLVTVAAAALAAMWPYVDRAVKANLKQLENAINAETIGQ